MQRTLRSVMFAFVVALGIAALAPSAAQAQRPGGGTIHFDVHASFPAWWGIGGGGRVDITLTPQGVIHDIDDELTLSLGADLFFITWGGCGAGFNCTGLAVAPVAAVQWNFFLNREWSIFPELGLAFLFGPYDWNNHWGYVYPEGGFGVRYHFSPNVSLLLAIRWPAGFEIGVAFL